MTVEGTDEIGESTNTDSGVPATAAVAPAPDTTLEWYPAEYRGAEGLSGIEPTGSALLGTYAEQEGLFLFMPQGSTKIFEVSDEDIVRIGVPV